MTAIRIGIDLIEVADIEDALSGAGSELYLQRVYTQRELRECSSSAGIDAGCLAARFAAKEAALKVLLSPDEGLALRSIEVRVGPLGRCSIRLRDRAAGWALEAGIRNLTLSLTHRGRYAAAIVLAECPGPLAKREQRQDRAKRPDPPRNARGKVDA